MHVAVIIIFPYRGLGDDGRKAQLFWKLVEVAHESSDCKPVIVINHDTVGRGEADSYLEDPRREELDEQQVWSVDTCQMWLHGWGHVLNRHPHVDRIVQLPGDLERLGNEADFFSRLRVFATLDRWSMVIGDFKVGKFGAKSLIDQYGTYPLMSIWFPRLTRTVLGLPLNRPRSEFLNLEAETLRTLLQGRKFAYEQTLNMLIGCWGDDTWRPGSRVTAHPLGALQDDDTARQYVGCLDQVERTERLLKQRWRELNQPPLGASDADYARFIETFHRLDRLSTASRESAAITIRSLLGIGAAETVAVAASAPGPAARVQVPPPLQPAVPEAAAAEQP